MKENRIDKQTEQAVRKAHQKAQDLADRAIAASAQATEAAIEAGKHLCEARKSFKTDVWAAWLEGTFGQEFASKWAPKYTTMARQLEFNLDNPDPRALRMGMLQLELIPTPPHESKPRAQIVKTWETELVRWVHKFGHLKHDAPAGTREFMKAQMRELFTWLRTELFND